MTRHKSDWQQTYTRTKHLRETHAYPVERASAGSEHAIVSTLRSSALPYGACATRESFGALSDEDAANDDDDDEADKGPLAEG